MPLFWLLACTSPEPIPEPVPEPIAVPAPEPATWASQEEPPVREPLDLTRPGPIVLRVERGARSSLVWVDGDGFHGGEEGLRDLHRAPDDSVWALGGDAVWRVDGDERVSLDGAPRGADLLAIDGRGRVWVVGDEALGRWDGATWVHTPLSPVGDTHPKDLYVDEQGRAWLAALNGVHRFDGDGWTALPLPSDPIPGTMSAGRDGAVHIGSSGGWFTATGEGWTRHTEVSAEEGVDAHGAVMVLASSHGSIDVTKGGAEVRTPHPVGVGAWGSASADTTGRAWVASEVGLHLVDGKETTTWLSASDPLLVGTIAQVVAVGAGPLGVPKPRPPQTAKVSMRFVRDGAPLAKARVELCPMPQMLFSGETPCDGSVYRVGAMTDADGVAVFEAAPRAALRVAFEAEGGWMGVMGRAVDCCVDVAVGELDLGDVELPRG